MATHTRKPTSDVSFTGTWTGSAGTRYQAVDDHPDSGNPIADGLTHGTATAGEGLFGFTAFNIPSGSTSITLRILFYCFKNASQACNINARIRCNDTTGRDSPDGTTNPGNGNANIALVTKTYTNNPKSGAAWTVDEINGVGTNGFTAFGVVSTDANPSITISSIIAEVQFTPPPASAGSYSLTGAAAGLTATRKVVASGGSYALTGGAADLDADRKLPATGGAYTFTGQDATLTYQPGGPPSPTEALFYRRTFLRRYYLAGRRSQSRTIFKKIIYPLFFQSKAGEYTLTADKGVYTLTGNTADLDADRKLIASSAVYTLTGGAADLDADRKLPAIGGVYTLTGVAADLDADRKLVSIAGSYILTGGAADLDADRKLICVAGKYVLNGSDAELIYSGSGAKVLTADKGSYILTGAAADLDADRRITATFGNYTLTGGPADLDADRRLIATPGGYVLTGQPVDLDVDRRITASTGVYALTGSTADLDADRRLFASPAAYTLTGSPADLDTDRRIVAGSGSYVLIGQPADLDADRRVAVGAGVYVLTGYAAILISSGEVLEDGGPVFYRLGTNERVFIRPQISNSRVFIRPEETNRRVFVSIVPSPIGGADVKLPAQTRYMTVREKKTIAFSFAEASAVIAGETLSLPEVFHIDPGDGLTFTGVQILAADFIDDDDFFVPAGKGVKVRIEAGGTGSFFIGAKVTTQQGDELEVDGRLIVTQ